MRRRRLRCARTCAMLGQRQDPREHKLRIRRAADPKGQATGARAAPTCWSRFTFGHEDGKAVVTPAPRSERYEGPRFSIDRDGGTRQRSRNRAQPLGQFVCRRFDEQRAAEAAECGHRSLQRPFERFAGRTEQSSALWVT